MKKDIDKSTEFTDRFKKAEKLLRESEEKYRKLMETANDAIFIANVATGIITEVNKKAEKLLGLPADKIIGLHQTDLHPKENATRYANIFKKHIRKGEDVEISAFVVHKDGHHIPVEISASVTTIRGTEIIQGIFRDVTKRKELENQLKSLAHFDLLTGLPNRKLFFDRLHQILSLLKRNKNIFALLFLDLDGFKNVNDTFGHDIGDLLLKETAKRLTDCVRESDTVARMGGDEFTIILAKIDDTQDVIYVAQRVIDSLGKPFHLMGNECSIGVSIGISMYPYDGKDTKSLLSNADIAMYCAKRASSNNYQFYTFEMFTKALQRVTRENDLRKAIQQDEFTVYYQPQLNIKTKEVVGVEALARWQHPSHGLLLPKEFIPLAKETGLILRIDEFVMRTACAQNKSWQESSFSNLRLTVNLSEHWFKQKQQLEIIKKILHEVDLSPDFLELELTESILLDNSASIVIELSKLEEYGLFISVDDFGIGYSSLSHLKRLPIYKLKIDRSFIRDITTDPDERVIVTAIINMAHNLNLKVIAEGVETKEQLEILSALNCDEMQGYLACKPIPAEELTKLLTSKTVLI